MTDTVALVIGVLAVGLAAYNLGFEHNSNLWRRRYEAAIAVRPTRVLGDGFTREDADAIRLVHVSRPEIQARLESIADRIEALLPPESPSFVPVESSSFGEPK